MAEIVLYNGVKIISDEDLTSFVVQNYQSLKTLNTKQHQSVIDYLSELNGKSVIPDPDDTTGNWRTNIKSSIFFQKTIFAYLYLRSLLQKSTEQLVSFDSSTYKYLPSAYRKIFNWGIHKTRYFDAIDKALYYAILSSVYAISIEGEYDVDEFDEVEFNITVKPLHPLNFYFSADGLAYAIDNYIPIEKVSKIVQFWRNKNVDIKTYNLNTDNERTYYKTSSLSKKPVVKLTVLYTRYISSDGDVSVPYKFTILNDNILVDYEPLSHVDRRFPIVATSFYSDDMQISYADLIWDYYKEDSRFLRAIIDRAILSTALGYELNTSAIVNEDKTLTIKPFTVISTNNSEAPAIRPFTLANFDPNILPVRQLILQESQNVSALTEFLMGLPTSKGRPTAKEVLVKTQMNQQIISTIIYRLENEFIKKASQKLISLFLQYKLNDCMALLSDNERGEFTILINKAVAEQKEPYYYLIRELYKGIVIKVEGLSGIIQQSEEADKILNFVEVISNLGLISYIDVVKVFEMLFKKLGIPADIVRIPTPEELQAIAQNQQVKAQLNTEEMASIANQVLNNRDILEKVAKNPEVLTQYINAITDLKLQTSLKNAGVKNG